MVPSNEVLVGVDGSPGSDAAVIWAAAEAASRGAGLVAVHAFDTNSFGLWMTTASIRAGLRELAQPIIDDALRLAAEHHSSVPARGRVLIGSPTRILLLISGSVPLTVIGRSGRGALSRMWLGSITQRALAHASSPVVAVGSTMPDAPAGEVSRVVVGTDDGPAAFATLRFAFEEARRRHVPLQAIHAVQLPEWQIPGAVLPGQFAEAEERQAKALAGWEADYPDVVVTPIVRSGRPAEVLAAACTSTDLMVLGHHRRAPSSPSYLGAVAAAALHASACPVAVVHEPAANVAG